MVKAVIFRRPFESESMKTGLGRYADGIQGCLKAEDVEYIPMDLSLKRGIKGLLIDGMIRPLLHLINCNDKSVTYHATDELCGALFPFVKGRRILTVHHVITDNEWDGIFSLIWRKLTKYAVKKADTIISISEPTTADLIDIGVDPDKIVTIDNRVDTVFRRLDIRKSRYIGCMGSLYPRKNMQDSLLAFFELIERPGMDDLELRIVGKGPEEENLRLRSKELGIDDKVSFLKDLDEQELVKFYNESLLIFNTSLHEGFGLVTLEAQACGTPTLHLAHAHIPEVVTRMSIPCESPHDMARKAYDLLNDKCEYNRISKKSEEYVADFNNGYCRRYRSVLFDDYNGPDNSE